MTRIEIPGVAVGHWTDTEARTGCTVIRLPEGTVASGEIRGGAPATREFGLLDPGTLVDRVDAVVLSGGSAFGLAAADGVVDVLESEGRGFPTAAGPVPIVVAMALYDLNVGEATVRPGADAGRAALLAATDRPAVGAVGAGTGATVGKWRGPDHARRGGLGIVTTRRGPLAVTAIVALNAAGDVDDGATTGRLADGTFEDWPDRSEVFANTTIGAVITNAALDVGECLVVAQGAHDGLARSLVPAHMRTDGDAFVAAATGGAEAHVDDVRLLAVVAVEQAVRAAVDTLDA